MSFTVREIITEAMSAVGAVAKNEVIDDDDANFCLRRLNMMLGKWAANRLLLRSTTPLTFPTVIGQFSYTIGSGITYNINAPKPTKVQSGSLRDTGLIDSGLNIIEVDEFNALTDKGVISARPELLTYDPGATQQIAQSGTILMYPTPDQVYTIKLEVDSFLTEFTSLYDTVTLEPIYYEPLVYNLGLRIFRRFHTDIRVPVPEDLKGLAHAALQGLMQVNSVRVHSPIDFAAPGRYNIYSDGYP